jgi:hypothetical protein
MTGDECAVLLVDAVRALSAARRELADLRLLHAAERDYLAWLQAEVRRARGWTIVDVVKAWCEEIDRRKHQRDTMRAHSERAA